MSRPKLPGLTDQQRADFAEAISDAKSYIFPTFDAAAAEPNVTRTDARRIKQLADGIHARLLQLEAWVNTGNWIGEAKPKPEQGNG